MKDKLTSDQLKKFLKIKENAKDSHKEMFDKIQKYYSGWEGWYCNVEDCGHVVGLDTGDMFDHLQTHTKEELKTVDEND